jgi:hypothetical protein
MESNEPPLFVIVPGTVYRRDTMDATHLPMFSQVEGLAVAEDITLADLAGTLQEVARALFGDERETRLKPDFFPFTEPRARPVDCNPQLGRLDVLTRPPAGDTSPEDRKRKKLDWKRKDALRAASRSTGRR